LEKEVFELQGRIEEVHWWFTGRRDILLGLASLMLPDSGTVLDVGCGTGGNISAFSPRHRRIGVDPSPTAISLARGKSRDVEFICGAAPTDVVEALGAADLVLLTDVLEHVEEDRKLLAGLAGGMKEGATLIITVPAEPRLWSPHDTAHGHYRRYTSETLARLWGGLPLHPLLFAPLNRRLYPVVRSLRFLARILRRSVGSAGTDLSLPPRPLNQLLRKVFSGEGKRLSRALTKGQNPPNGPGVSLIALLRRSAGAAVSGEEEEA
jgi:SAM-dependent methyltransferase